MWIEILLLFVYIRNEISHHPHGWCGLKSIFIYRKVKLFGHHPHGWCGLKLIRRYNTELADKVTTHTGGVDWNTLNYTMSANQQVTTHTGGVDWNSHWQLQVPYLVKVTTHTGGVDWNLPDVEDGIEWTSHHPHGWCGLKFNIIFMRRHCIMSPPTRVVWIEIELSISDIINIDVTTHTGGVDWNCCTTVIIDIIRCHHPHGWCGLKYRWVARAVMLMSHHPHGWCGLKSYSIYYKVLYATVTTHTGGVDWNFVEAVAGFNHKCHHPHGWCGLKLSKH